MKIAMIIVRTLMGLLFIASSLIVLIGGPATPPDLSPNMKMFVDGMAASGYMLTLVKVTELMCGIAFVTGRYVALATVVIAPVIINILLVHIYLERSGLPVAIFLVLANCFVAWWYWDKYKPLLEAK